MARIEMAELRKALGDYDAHDLAQALAEADRGDLLAAVYPVDGPHDHDRTADAAVALSALVRFLNYATARESGTPHPGTLDRVVANLEAAAGGLQQTTRQAARRLDQFADDPDLASDGMAYEDMSPPEIAARAAELLREAGGLLEQLHTILTEAHNHVARLYLGEGN